MISVFDIFKISIGPSSSHTVGPMKAGKQFVDTLQEKGLLHKVTRLVVDVYGSLSLTGKGHHTDIAIILGLSGYLPDTVDIDAIPGIIRDVNTMHRLFIEEGQREIQFPVAECMRFHNEFLPLHENGMSITAFCDGKIVHFQTYYSIGGGLSSRRKTLVRTWRRRLIFRSRSILPATCWRTARTTACRFPP